MGLEFALSRPGFRVRLKAEESLLTIEPNKIEVSTLKRDTDCGKILARILKKLPETPMLAAGVNVAFSRTLRNGESVRQLTGLPEQVAGEEVERQSIGLRFAITEARSQSITLEKADRLIKMTGNAEQRGNEARDLADFIEQFMSHVESLQNLIKNAWTVEVHK